MRKAIVFAPLCAYSLLVTHPAAAQAVDAGADDAIVVTANRTPLRIDQVGQSVTVLNEAAIDASQAIGVTELIAQTPGVQFSRNGGPGTTTSVYIRGAETGQTVILYDGVRLQDTSAPDGAAALTDIMTADIGRIEVLRGAQSTLYGSQAIGGVVNIITHRPRRPFEADLQAEAGGLDSWLVKGGVGGRQGGLTWRAGAGYDRTDGISAYAPGTERDGYENLSLNGRIDYAFNDAVQLDLRSFYTSGDADFDGFNADAPNRADTASWLNYAGLNIRLFGRLQNRIAYARTDIDRTNYDETDPAAPMETFDSTARTDRYEYQGTLDIRNGTFAVFGVEHVENSMETLSYGVAMKASGHTTGVYGQLTVEPVTGLTLTGGVRHEDHSTFGGNTVGSASAAYTPNGGTTVLRASWAQGFKAPSLYQLHSDYGNPALAPEQADSWDVGIEQRLLGVVSLSAVLFERDSDNLITYVGCTADTANPLCSDGRYGFYDNVGRVEAIGLEVGAALDLGAFDISANYTRLDAENTTPGDANEGMLLARRPADTINLAASYSWPFGLVTGASVRVVGESFDDAGNLRRIGGYTTADFRLSYPVSDRIEIYGRVENAFDEDYETVADYGTMPRVFYGGVRFSL